MTAEKSPYLSDLFKRCLHLSDDTSAIECSLEELRKLQLRDLSAYFAVEVQLAPLLWWHLKRRGLTRSLGEPLAEDLRQRYQENVARNFLFEQSLERILSRFNREGVEVIVLKGASAFTTGLHLFRDAFVLFDIDLLVRPSDVQRATKILASDGYSLTQTQVMGGAVKQGFLGADNFTRIDLHSALFWTGVRLDYRDFFHSDFWAASTLDSVAGWPVRILSREDQICYRLVHDTLGHETVLLSNISRLYYLCALVRLHADSVNWNRLLKDTARNGGDRLLLAYIYYGKRELGAPVPSELEQFHDRACNDLAYLDAVACASSRLADYAHRTSVALLAARTLHERLKTIFQLLMRNSSILSLRARKAEGPSGMNVRSLMLKRFCLQSAALLYVGAYTLRHSILRKENENAGRVFQTSNP
jgi:hypothetical protein